jgi:hypothetical protein
MSKHMFLMPYCFSGCFFASSDGMILCHVQLKNLFVDYDVCSCCCLLEVRLDHLFIHSFRRERERERSLVSPSSVHWWMQNNIQGGFAFVINRSLSSLDVGRAKRSHRFARLIEENKCVKQRSLSVCERANDQSIDRN